MPDGSSCESARMLLAPVDFSKERTWPPPEVVTYAFVLSRARPYGKASMP